MIGWHFTKGLFLRDGRRLPAVGETLRHDGPLVPCESGLHFSERAIDALQYAPGAMCHRVEGSGEMLPHGGDKWCARERTILWSIDATEVLHTSGRAEALRVSHLREAPPVVLEYLRTGNPAIRAAAFAAAWASARAAAFAAAWDAAWDAARDAAWSAQNERLEAMLIAAHEKETAP